MIKKDIKVIREWSKLRQPTNGDWQGIEKAGHILYQTLDSRDQSLLINEFQGYIDSVKNGIIKASPVELKIPVYKRPDRTLEDQITEDKITDYYKGN